MILPADLKAAVSLPVISKAVGVTLDFPSETVLLWNGFGWLRTGSTVWRGASLVADLGAIERAASGASSRLAFSLSGVDAGNLGVALAAYDAGEILETPVAVDFIYFGADGKPVSTVFRQHTGAIVKFAVDQEAPAERTAAITYKLSVESADDWSNRNSASHAFLTSAWLNSIYPDARGLDLVPTLFDATIAFPDFR